MSTNPPVVIEIGGLGGLQGPPGPTGPAGPTGATGATGTVPITTIPADKTADYTLVLGDATSSIGVDSATAKNVTVPPNSAEAFPIGTLIEIRQVGAGQITLVPGAGVILRSAAGALKTTTQYSVVAIRKIATDVWSVRGDSTT